MVPAKDREAEAQDSDLWPAGPLPARRTKKDLPILRDHEKVPPIYSRVSWLTPAVL